MSLSVSRTLSPVSRIIVGLGFAALALVHLLATPWDAGFAGGDPARHALNGALLLDWARSLDWRHPYQFAINYYLHYPAITIALYPPLVPALEAASFALFGVSQASALLVVTLFSAMALGATYAIARLALPPLPSLAAAALLAAAPSFIELSRQVMLEVPALGLATAGAALLLRYMQSRRSRQLWLGILAVVAAAYAKQIAAVALLVWPILMLWQVGPKLLRSREVWLATGAGLLALVPLAVYTLAFGHWLTGTLVAGTQGSGVADWAFYLRALPGLIGWPTLTLALACWLSAAFMPLTHDERLLVRFGAIWTLVILLALTAIGHKEPRYATLALAPIAVLAVLLVWRLLCSLRWRRELAALAAVAFAGIIVARSALVERAPWVGGYEAVAGDVAARAQPGEVVMFEGIRVQDFAFALRRLDARAPFGGPLVVRPVKFLVDYAGERDFSATDRQVSDAEIASLFEQFGVRWVVLEPGFWSDLPSVAGFEHAIRHGHFRLAASYPVTGDRDPADAPVVEIWENTQPSGHAPDHVEFDMPLLGGRFSADVARP